MGPRTEPWGTPHHNTWPKCRWNGMQTVKTLLYRALISKIHCKDDCFQTVLAAKFSLGCSLAHFWQYLYLAIFVLDNICIWQYLYWAIFVFANIWICQYLYLALNIRNRRILPNTDQYIPLIICKRKMLFEIKRTTLQLPSFCFSMSNTFYKYIIRKWMSPKSNKRQCIIEFANSHFKDLSIQCFAIGQRELFLIKSQYM